MGRTAYWKAGSLRVPSRVLGDASRGALYLALRPAASNGEKPAATTPRAAGFKPTDSGTRALRRLLDAQLRAVALDADGERLLPDPVLVAQQLALALGQGQNDPVGQREAGVLPHRVHAVDQVARPALELELLVQGELVAVHAEPPVPELLELAGLERRSHRAELLPQLRPQDGQVRPHAL